MGFAFKTGPLLQNLQPIQRQNVSQRFCMVLYNLPPSPTTTTTTTTKSTSTSTSTSTTYNNYYYSSSSSSSSSLLLLLLLQLKPQQPLPLPLRPHSCGKELLKQRYHAPWFKLGVIACTLGYHETLMQYSVQCHKKNRSCLYYITPPYTIYTPYVQHQHVRKNVGSAKIPKACRFPSVLSVSNAFSAKSNSCTGNSSRSNASALSKSANVMAQDGPRALMKSSLTVILQDNNQFWTLFLYVPPFLCIYVEFHCNSFLASLSICRS